MSEMYEGVVIPAGAARLRGAFDELRSPLTLRLAELAPDVCGVWRVARRHENFDPEVVEAVGAALSDGLGLCTLVVFYNNQVGLREAVLFDPAVTEARVFGEEDEWWVPLDDEGEPITNGPRFRADQMEALEAQDEDAEFDCVWSALDAGLDALGVADRVHTGMLKQAFCYDGCGWLAEHRPA